MEKFIRICLYECIKRQRLTNHAKTVNYYLKIFNSNSSPCKPLGLIKYQLRVEEL